ncbi:MAG TPA: iron hydrogenase [Ruminococcaceae bacterium]|nr:iron hydrogenase [Oscillospiraceae bacterium]
MRGIYTPVTKIRRQVFAEVAKLAYDGENIDIENIPYKIIPGEIPTYRDSVFKERAIVGERVRLAMGLNLRRVDEHAPLSKGIEDADIPEKYYEPPLINVISFACNACPETAFFVTDNCRKCLAHPCVNVCPVQAVSIIDGKSHIDKDKCLKCGRCKDACPYSAIVKYERPCAASCGVDAIESDHLGRAKINYDKCVSCGQCLVSCPFSAIADKSQIWQLIRAIKAGYEVVAEIAPSFVGQFGPYGTPDRIKKALKMLGFAEVYEVAIGADIGAVEEAHHFAKHIATGEQPFLATSCCPSWSVMAKTKFPTIAPYISNALTPMVATARIIKQKHPDSKVVFIGPCASKKLEASRRTVKSDVDFVITFEELMGMFVAKEIEFSDIESDEPLADATATGRGYAVSGGVAGAITDMIGKLYPELDVNVDRAEGLKNCQKMLALAKAGKRNGYLLEGMACPGGCVAGAGTILPIQKAQQAVAEFKQRSQAQSALDSRYVKQAFQDEQ